MQIYSHSQILRMNHIAVYVEACVRDDVKVSVKHVKELVETFIDLHVPVLYPYVANFPQTLT